MPPTVWCRPYTQVPQLVACVGTASWFCPFPSKIKPSAHFTAGYAGEELDADEKPKPKNQPDCICTGI